MLAVLTIREVWILDTSKYRAFERLKSHNPTSSNPIFANPKTFQQFQDLYFDLLQQRRHREEEATHGAWPRLRPLVRDRQDSGHPGLVTTGEPLLDLLHLFRRTKDLQTTPRSPKTSLTAARRCWPRRPQLRKNDEQQLWSLIFPHLYLQRSIHPTKLSILIAQRESAEPR